MAKKKKPVPAKAVGSKKPRKVGGRAAPAPKAKKNVVGDNAKPQVGKRGSKKKAVHKPKPRGKAKGRPMKRTGLRAVIFDINKYCKAAKERFAKAYPELGKDALAKDVWDRLRAVGLRPTRHNIKQVLRDSELIRKKRKKGEKQEPEQPPQDPRLPVAYEDPVTKEKKVDGYWRLEQVNDAIPTFFDERIYIKAKEIMGPGIWLKGGVKYNYYETFEPFVRWANKKQAEAESWYSEKLMFRFSDLVQHPVKKDWWETSIVLIYEGEEDVKVILDFPGLDQPPTGAIVLAAAIEHPAPPKELPPAPAPPPAEPSARMKELELEIRKMELEIRKMELELQLKGEKTGTTRKRPAGKKKVGHKTKPKVAKKKVRAGLAPAPKSVSTKKKPTRKTTPAKKTTKPTAKGQAGNGKAMSDLIKLLNDKVITKAEFMLLAKKLK